MFRARNKKSVLVASTQELIEKAKSATELYKYYYDKEDGEEYRETRVRYAPSPTGEMHIGGLRTALYNYLFAKVNNGTFLLRIEDTDKSREVPDADKRIVDDLKWAGLKWTEGVGAQSENEGQFGPYYQSQRLHIYKKWVDSLVENKHAYH
jgi:nondiscriminating glutamyl-tRNA synthetase